LRAVDALCQRVGHADLHPGDRDDRDRGRGRVDRLGRQRWGASRPGPESAASEPGPACYQRGGQRPAITDADLVLGKLDPDNFAGGAIKLSTGQAAQAAIARDVGDRLAWTAEAAAFGICEVVDENMANAARVHAVENGKNIADNIMVAFGGAAPCMPPGCARSWGSTSCLIPPGAGVGSAIGFLKAPFGYEALASQASSRLSSISTRRRSMRCWRG
jgi:N-methylhydantoinase A